MNDYEVSLEVSGPMAMWTRPDTGGTPTSYPAPTWSAAKGLFESIAFFADGAAWICPTRVEVCRRVGEPGGRVYFQRYTTNYGGPLRKGALFNKGNVPGGSSMQLFATILSDVCYRLHGIVVGPCWQGSVNPRHYLKDLFDRRLKRGQCFRTPCLGWSEFTCSYWGPLRCTQLCDGNESPGENEAWKSYCEQWVFPFRNETEVDDKLTLEVPSMLLAIWDNPNAGCYAPRFTQGLRNGRGHIMKPLMIKNGILEYNVPHEWVRERNREVATDAE